jgi:glycosyltransferase involved in cell wall biosynthesis
MLMISIELPFPPTSGGRMKSWNMVDYLGRHYELGLACPLKYGTAEIDSFKSKTNLRDFVTDRVEIPRSGGTLFKSYLKGIPINVMRSQSSRIKKEIAQIANNYDIILLDHYESAQYVPSDYQGKVILHTHNATYLMWERYAKSDANIAFRAATYLEAIRVKRYELMAAENADLVFASPNDIDSLAKIGVDRQKCRVTYHLGDDNQLDLPSLEFDKTEKALLYIGTLSWEANVDGLLWFFESIWPKVKQQHPDLHFYVVGGNADPRLLEAAKNLDDVEFTGFVDELEPYFQKARLFMAPLRFGSGIKVKVLNAMSRGMPTITTSVGSEGLIAEHMKHLSITDDADDMVSAIDRLLTDKEKWQELERESRKLVAENYTWNKVLGYMVDEINKLFEAE